MAYGIYHYSITKNNGNFVSNEIDQRLRVFCDEQINFYTAALFNKGFF